MQTEHFIAKDFFAFDSYILFIMVAEYVSIWISDRHYKARVMFMCPLDWCYADIETYIRDIETYIRPCIGILMCLSDD